MMRSLPRRLAAVHARCTAVAALLILAASSASAATAYSVPSLAPAASSTPAATVASVTAVISPNQLGRRAALTITIQDSGGDFGVPTPVRRATVKFPAGLTLAIPRLKSCSVARLRAHGVVGCAGASRLGSGSALAVVHAGSQRLAERVALTAFLGPLQGLQPTLLILAQGYTPVERRFVLIGKVLPAGAPYGEEMVMAIPAIPSLPFEPDASLATFSLTVGASSHRRAGVQVPASCPLGGFPFDAEITYADTTSASALATVPCPA